jgi:hypothetical protein
MREMVRLQEIDRDGGIRPRLRHAMLFGGTNRRPMA